MIESVSIAQTKFGTSIETEGFTALFGNRNGVYTDIKSEFPNFNFKRIKQTHGDRIVHTSPHSIDFASEADAHFTGESKLALCISTADCIPVLIYSKNPRLVSAIHAGWRGVANRITIKTIQNLIRQGCKSNELLVLIGPHIGSNSFQVKNDVRDQLLKSAKITEPEDVVSRQDGEFCHVDLLKILLSQLSKAGIESNNIGQHVTDTFTDLNYNSFRRDRENSGRQLSWIALK